VFAARVAGFDNVHDFLVHLETGESPVVIARRKDGREWTNGGRFKCEEAPEDFLTESHKDSCLDGHKDVAPRTTDMSTKLQRKILCRKYAKKVLLVCVIFFQPGGVVCLILSPFLSLILNNYTDQLCSIMSC
jgi:hypothetical protein